MPAISDLANSGAPSHQILNTPAHKISKMIKAGQLASTELCKFYIERIKLVQPVVHAVCENRFDEALREAAAIDELIIRSRNNGFLSPDEAIKLNSPLLGVPLSVKECIAIAGMTHSCGLWKRRNTKAVDDAIVVQNAKRFGLIPICTTNVPEMTMFWADCSNRIYGTTYNPYDQSRVPGASSGGEGALLGAGASLLGIGTDIGGSLRNPAHYSGVMSHKPSPFLLSPEGNFPVIKEARLRLFTMGPMSRYASDLRFLLMVLMKDGENPKKDSYLIHQPRDISRMRQRVLDQLNKPLDLTRVKFFYGNFKSVGRLRAIFKQREPKIHPEIMEAQRNVLGHFNSKFSCQIEQIELDECLEKTFQAWLAMMLCGGTVDREEAYEEHETEKILGLTNPKLEMLKMFFGFSKHTKETVGTLVFGLPAEKSRAKVHSSCQKYEQWVSSIKERFETMLGDYGCIVIPTLPTVAHKHNKAMIRSKEARFPWLWNILQFPVTHVTIKLDKAHGLPLGLSIASKPGNDAITIAVAEEIERSLGGWTYPQNHKSKQGRLNL